jgi:hypothetical protein
MHDIYDPPPAQKQEALPIKREPFIFTNGDLYCLLGLCALLFLVSLVAWSSEPAIALATAAGALLVVLESWSTALGFLHRCPPLRLKARWTIFLAALLPWLLGLGVAVTVMISLFWISDRLS